MQITTENVIELLEQAVATKGENFIYKRPVTPGGERGTCRYVDPGTGEPSCIVGHVIALASTTDLAEVGAFEKRKGASSTITDLPDVVTLESIPLAPTDYKWDHAVLSILQAAQSQQDNGNTWGDALTAAKARAALVNTNA